MRFDRILSILSVGFFVGLATSNSYWGLAAGSYIYSMYSNKD